MSKQLKLDGTWANDYGSTMELAVRDGAIHGVYECTVGDVGRYRVVGMVDGLPADAGCTLGLIVSWRNLDAEADGVGDESPSAHWMTSLTGQLHRIDGEDVLTTTFLLTKNTPAEDRWEDTIVNTMVFRRVAGSDL